MTKDIKDKLDQLRYAIAATTSTTTLNVLKDVEEYIRKLERDFALTGEPTLDESAAGYAPLGGNTYHIKGEHITIYAQDGREPVFLSGEDHGEEAKAKE